MTDTQPAALRLADQLDAVPETGADPQTIQDAAAELRRLHAYCQELESQVIFDCMTHIQNHAENEHVAGDVSKNGAESNMSAQQEAQEPCPTCAALARTVMLDQVSFDRKPDCYGIRQITDDEGVEEWEDIRTSPDVAREEANDMMATGRGEIYEVVPLWTTPKPSPTAQAAESVQDMQSVNDAVTIELPPLPDPDLRDVGTTPRDIKEFLRGYATEYAKAALAAWNTRTPQPTQAQVGAVPLDEARRLFDAGWKAAALFCDREDVVADGIIGFGACPQFEAAFSAARGIKGGQHGTE